METQVEEKVLAREVTVPSGDRKMYAAGALLIILGLYYLEFQNYLEHGHISLTGTGMDTVILGLWMYYGIFKIPLARKSSLC